MVLAPTTPLRLLTIAGSDSGAGAGIQADLKTFAAHSVYGSSVLTALTAQNTLGVQGISGVSPAFVALQLDSVLGDIGVDGIKLGMLFSKEVVGAIADTFAKWFKEGEAKPPIVLDPVCVSTSGHELLPASALEELKTRLIPWSTVITPNIPEAKLLAQLNIEVEGLEGMRACAKKLGTLGARWVLVKGGHLPLEFDAEGKGKEKRIVDLLWDAQQEKEWTYEHSWIETKNTHGTGCTLSSALASQLARGVPVPEAVQLAADYVAHAIGASYALGSGSGPVNHFFNVMPRSLPLPTPYAPRPFTDYLIKYTGDKWQDYTFHPFPNGLAAGTMPLSGFLHFIQQDYHFLKQYGRTHSLAAYKTENMKEMAESIGIVDVVLKETEMHIAYCEKYGISRAQLMAIPESVTNIAYTRYVLDTAMRGDLLSALVVTAPCLIGYGHVGARLVAATEGVDTNEESNPYWGWIKEYGSEWYQGAVTTGIEKLEEAVARGPISDERLQELAKTFLTATELEIAFWSAAVRISETEI